MINKKRLVMMAVAASMVLPTNLIYLSMMTPVLAEEDTTSNFQKGIFESSGYSYLTPGTYTLTGKESLSNTIILYGETTIDIGNYDIESTAAVVFQTYSTEASPATIKIKGSGNIISKSTAQNGVGVISINGGGITFTTEDSVTFTHQSSEGWGIIVNEDAPSANITLNGSTLNAMGGITVNGSMSPDTPPTVEMNDVTITSTGEKSVGVYQAGPSTFKITDGTITADNCGIEVRAGSLEVNGTTVQGGSASVTKSIKNTSPTNGATSYNSGIAIAQHGSKLPIIVRIQDAKIKGYTALAITDPETNLSTQDPKAGNISVVASDSVLEGTVRVGYTTEPAQASNPLDITLINNFTDQDKETPLDDQDVKLLTGDNNTSGLSVDTTQPANQEDKIRSEKIDLSTLSGITFTTSEEKKFLLGNDSTIKNYEKGDLNISFPDALNIPLVEDIDYTVSITASEVGKNKGEVIVKAPSTSSILMSQYTIRGSVVDVYGDLEDADIEFNEIYTLNSFKLPSVKYNGTLLEEGVHYTLEFNEITSSSEESTPKEKTQSGSSEFNPEEGKNYTAIITAIDSKDNFYIWRSRKRIFYSKTEWRRI